MSPDASGLLNPGTLSPALSPDMRRTGPSVFTDRAVAISPAWDTSAQEKKNIELATACMRLAHDPKRASAQAVAHLPRA